MKVRCSTASKIRISITDGVNTAYSSYHSGGGTYELLQAVLTFDSTPTTCKVTIDVVSDFAEAFYFDSGYCYVIPPQMESASRALLAYSSLGEVVSESGLLGYRRPVLVYNNSEFVDVENNTGTAHETKIVFPDGEVRTVIENVSSTTKYRRFDITSAAEFISGTENSGLYTGLSEATNTSYAIYAVKSRIDATKFILVGTTTLPIQADYATLNTNLGANSWIYLGMIFNGDWASATGNIVAFDQVGNFTCFKNTCAITANDGWAGGSPGLRLVTGTGNSLTWTYAAGTAANQIPSHIKVGLIMGLGGARSAAVYALLDSGGNHGFAVWIGAGIATRARITASVLAGFMVLDLAATTSNKHDIILSGYHDGVLGVGSNPVT
jgi:hypothetical protein